MVLTATARVETQTPERYAKQLCSHLGRRSEAQYDAGEGVIELTRGTVHLRSLPGELVLTASAETPEALAAVCDVAGRHLERFGQRHELSVQWDPAQDAGGPAEPADRADDAGTADPPIEEFL
jgi:hypothetical protein